MPTISERRLLIHTDKLLKRYLENGTLPDELLIAEQIKAEFAAFTDPATGIIDVNVPLWQASNIGYRETSSYSKWNTTQTSAAEDTDIAYTDLLEDVDTLTNGLYDYINRSQLIRNRINKLVNRITNLLLIATDTDGFLYSFYDSFIDTSFVSFENGKLTTALVNTSTNNVELPVDITTDISGTVEETSIVNLLFINGDDVSLSILNNVVSQTSLSTTPLTDIFKNTASAWQRDITISDSGPLVVELKVRIAPLEPIFINRVEMHTKMTSYANQIMVQVLTSEDGISYTAINSPDNPQFISTSMELNFTPIFAAWVKFIITKQVPDSFNTYNIGFQYITFQKLTYALTAELYSVPISFPDGRPINKVACETCTVEPLGTSIDYFIVVGDPVFIPISRGSDKAPKFPKVVDLSSLTEVTANVDSLGSHQWTPGPSGILLIDASGLAQSTAFDPADPTIIDTMTIYRNFGDIPSITPSGLDGWQSQPSGTPPEFFKSYFTTSDSNGTHVDVDGATTFIDKRLVNGSVLLNPGLHTVETKDFDKLQSIIAADSDIYFAWNMQFVSEFDFYNNVSRTDPSVFTYNPITGEIIINELAAKSQNLEIDFAKTFLPSPANDGTFRSSLAPLGSSFGGPTITSAGTTITVDLGGYFWINEIQIKLTSDTNTIMDISTSIDNTIFTTVLTNVSGPPSGTGTIASIKLKEPVFCEFIRLLVTSISNIDMTGGFIEVLPAIQITQGTLWTKNIFLPSGNIWSGLDDALTLNSSQTVELYSSFNDSLVAIFTPNDPAVDIGSVYIPEFYAKILSNVSVDPYVVGLTITSSPLVDEKSHIEFSYQATNSTNTITSVQFKARLSSNSDGITPQLKSYRLKLL